MKKNILLAGAVLFLCGQFAFAAPKVIVRLASLVPENTAWGASLNKLAKEWKDATNGDVDVIIYHGGIISSNEVEVLQKLRQNQVQAAVLTSAGLSAISDNIWTLSCPFLIQNNDELDYVLNDIKPSIEASIEAKNYKVVEWSKAGWIKFFGRDPIPVPEDLKKQKLVSDNTTPVINSVFKKLGYNVVMTNYNDTLSTLSSRKADAVYQLPIFVAAMQVFGIAKNMCSVNVAPVMGGIVVNETTWKKIPDKYKPKLLDICANLEKENNSSIADMEKSAIDIMLKNGLVINQVSPAEESLWVKETLGAMPDLIAGNIIDKDLYQRIEVLLKKKRGK
jgi:TRAP-type C4-dicarboxylate transport system substrate-binding protein